MRRFRVVPAFLPWVLGWAGVVTTGDDPPSGGNILKLRIRCVYPRFSVPWRSADVRYDVHDRLYDAGAHAALGGVMATGARPIRPARPAMPVFLRRHLAMRRCRVAFVSPRWFSGWAGGVATGADATSGGQILKLRILGVNPLFSALGAPLRSVARPGCSARCPWPPIFRVDPFCAKRRNDD